MVTRLVFQDDVSVGSLLAVLCLRGAGRLRGCSVAGDVQSVNDSGDVTEDGEEDVDEQVCAAAALEEDADGGEEDGEDDLADVAGVGVSCGEFENWGGGGVGGCVASIAVLGEVDLRAAGGFEAGWREDGERVVPSSESHDEIRV